jgi:excisionase family DNA binding protein
MSSNITIKRICQYCGKEFTAHTTVTKYCSHKCASAAYKARKRTEKVQISNKETSRIILQPINELKAKEFLSIAETCKLMGISRRTVYRMIGRGELITGKAGNRTILRRSDLDKLFEQSIPVQLHPTQYEITDCYTLTEIQNKYGISARALHEIIKRNNIPKLRKEKIVFVPKIIIDNLLN